MREILFRGKRIDGGGWVEDDLQHGELYAKGKTFIWPNNDEPHEVDPATVGQFTGREDINGRRIFEKDVVRCANNHVGVVVWEEHDCCFNVEGYYEVGDDYPSMAFIEGQPFEVIGNIHDNPELVGPDAR